MSPYMFVLRKCETKEDIPKLEVRPAVSSRERLCAFLRSFRADVLPVDDVSFQFQGRIPARASKTIKTAEAIECRCELMKRMRVGTRMRKTRGAICWKAGFARTA